MFDEQPEKPKPGSWVPYVPPSRMQRIGELLLDIVLAVLLPMLIVAIVWARLTP